MKNQGVVAWPEMSPLLPLLSTSPHATIFTDSGIPSADIRLMTLTAINASRFWASQCRARRRSPIMRSYRYIPFSACAWRWAPDSFRH